VKSLVEFIETKSVEKATIFEHLKCNKEEAIILQSLSNRFLKAQDDVLILDLLQDLFGDKDYQFLEYLKNVKNLLELGWLNQQSFTPIKISEVTPLELLNSSVGLSPSFLKLLQFGTLESDLPDIKPYADHLEYLQDEFFRIELYQKMS
jgi:archaellum biogenesis ATPase FlaH